MELNVREESLKDLFKQFQVEHNANCKTVFIDNNDPELENYLKTDYIGTMSRKRTPKIDKF